MNRILGAVVLFSLLPMAAHAQWSKVGSRDLPFEADEGAYAYASREYWHRTAAGDPSFETWLLRLGDRRGSLPRASVIFFDFLEPGAGITHEFDLETSFKNQRFEYFRNLRYAFGPELDHKSNGLSWRVVSVDTDGADCAAFDTLFGRSKGQMLGDKNVVGYFCQSRGQKTGVVENTRKFLDGLHVKDAPSGG